MRLHQSASRNRRLVVSAWAIGLMLSATVVARAQSFSVSGSPGPLRIASAVAGSQPASAVDNSTTYTVRTGPHLNMKIAANLDANMPAGTTLTINLAPVQGATSQGNVNLSTTTTDLVTNITTPPSRTASITYTFTATAAAGVISSSPRTVTFTLLAGP